MVFKPLNFTACTCALVFVLLSTFSRPVTVSIDWCRSVPVVILDAWFCTLLSLSKFDFDAVPHPATPYSGTDWTCPECILFCILWSAPEDVSVFFVSAVYSLAFAEHCRFDVSM